jgi:Bacterial Ig domain
MILTDKYKSTEIVSQIVSETSSQIFGTVKSWGQHLLPTTTFYQLSIFLFLLSFGWTQQATAQACGSCASANCVGVKSYSNKATAQGGSGKVWKYYSPGLLKATGTFTVYVTIHTDANGQVAVFQEIQIYGPTPGISTNAQAVAPTRTYGLYSLSDVACANKIPATIANDGCSSTFNPGWTNLVPNTDYKLALTTNISALQSGYEYQGFNFRYYNNVCPVTSFTFNCGAASATGSFFANGVGGQAGTLTVPISGATTGAASFFVSGNGFSGTAAVNVVAGQTSVSVPLTYDGSGAAGTKTLTVTSPQGTGTCTPSVIVQGQAAKFTFNCGAASATGTYTANGTGGQTGTLTVPLSNVTAGTATFAVSGNGFTGSLSTTLTVGQASVAIPITYNGSGTAGNHLVSVASSQGTGSCSLNIGVNAPNATFTFSCGTGVVSGSFVANAVTNQNGFVTVPLTSATKGSATFAVAGTGFTGSLVTTLVAGQASVVIPITYDGSGVAGTRALAVTSAQGSGACSINAAVTAAGTPAAITFNCPATASVVGSFVANGAGGQKGLVSISFTTQTAGEVSFSMSGGGFSGSLTTAVVAGQTTVNMLVTYDGTGTTGNHAVTVASAQGTGTCAMDIAVKGLFDFNCGVFNTCSNFVANGTSQTGTLVIPLSNVVAGSATFAVTGGGFTGTVTTALRDSQKYVVIPVTYDGSGTAGNHAVSITSAQGVGTCDVNVLVKDPALNGCDYIVGQPISVEIHSQNTNAGFTTKYILTDAAGVIKYQTAALPFTGVVAGDYLAYAVNYSGTAPTLTVGANISAMGGTCTSLSNAFPVKVCPAYQFNCGMSTYTGVFIANNTGGQTGTVNVAILNALPVTTTLTVTGTGFTGTVTTTLTAGQTSIDVPITYTGAPPAGTIPLTITSPDGVGTCSVGVNVIPGRPLAPLAFTCNSATVDGVFKANGTLQSGSVTLSLSGVTTSTTDFIVTGTNFGGGLFNAQLTTGQTSVIVPVEYNGAAPDGVYNITIGSPNGSNTCTVAINVGADIIGVVYHDNGVGGGTAGNCVKDGTEGALTLPTGLFAKLKTITGTTVDQVSPLATDGSFIFSSAGGSYKIIIDNNNDLTDTVSTLTRTWSGTSVWTGTIAAGVPTPPFNFCLNSTCTYGVTTDTIYAVNSTGTLLNGGVAQGATGTPNGTYYNVSSTGTTNQAILTYPKTFNTGDSIFITAKWNSGVGNDSIKIDFSANGVTYTTNVLTVNGFNPTSYITRGFKIPAALPGITGNPKYIRIQGKSATTSMNIDAVRVDTIRCASAPTTGLAYHDNGAGGGTKNNCIKDGTEGGATLPTGLFVKLKTITGTTAYRSAALAADGTFTMSDVVNGTYKVFVDNNNTSSDTTTTIIPEGWVASTLMVTVVNGVVTPAISLCLKFEDNDGDGIADVCDLDDDNDGVPDVVEDDACVLTGQTVRVGYIPDARSNGYTFDGSYMTPGSVPKLLDAANFGPNGTVKTSFTLVPITANPVTKASLDALNLNVVFLGGIDNGVTSNLVASEFAAIQDWSDDNDANIVVATQFQAVPWGVSISNANVNSDIPTTAGSQTAIFNGPFGNVTSFTQGGGFQGIFSGIPTNCSTTILANDANGKPVFFRDAVYKDLLIADVDILTSLGGISSGSTITTNNDKLFANLWNYIAKVATCGVADTDGDGIVNSKDLDSDGDGCSDALEAGATTNLTPNYTFPAPYGTNGLANSVETVADNGALNYLSTYSYAINAAYKACLDTDGDGIPDVCDIDDDNDGIPDVTEDDACVLTGQTIRVGYVPDTRSNGYTFDGTYMTPGSVPKLLNTANFGPSGTVKTSFTLVPITANPITKASLTALNLNVVFLGGIDNGVTSNLSGSEFTEIKDWSDDSDNKMVVATQFQALPWGTTIANANVNSDVPTTAGSQTAIFNGPFGNVTSFTQGGSFQGIFSGISNTCGTTILANDANGKPVFFRDAVYKDLLIADVDILTSLGGISSGNAISTNNDKLYANLWAYVARIATCGTADTDGDGIVNSKDTDSDNDGCSDALEAGATTSTTQNYTFPGPYGANGLADAKETAVDNGIINYTSTYSKATDNAIKACPSCAAGNTAPALTGTTVTNSCPITTTNLSALTATNKPAGTVLTWHTAATPTLLNKVVDSTAVATGVTYYAAFFDPAFECFTSVSTAVTATTTVCCAVATVGGTSAAAVSAFCGATNSGTITLSGQTGAVLKWQTSIDAGGSWTDIVSMATSYNFTNALDAQQYRAVLNSGSGCTDQNSSATTITVNPVPSAPTASVTAQPSCGSATGTITVTAPTGVGMTYSIDGTTYTNTNGIFAGVASGAYSITAKSSGGCVSPATSVTVNSQPPTPSVPTASATAQPSCAVAVGEITVTAPMGSGMTYSIDDATYTNTNGVFISIPAGTYSVTAKNAGGCISPPTSVAINAQPPTPATPSVNITQPTCSTATGTLTVTAPTGGGLTYSIDGTNYSNSTGIFTGVAAGTYSVTARSTQGCTSIAASVTVNPQPPTPSVPTAIAASQPSCVVATGTIVVSAPTGAGMTYSIDGLVYINTTGSFSGVGAGTYSVTAKNSQGCISPSTLVTIDPQPAIPAAPTTSVTQPTCAFAKGSITISAPTGAGMTYSINGATYTNATGSFSLVSPGTYSVTAKNSGGCISPATSVTVNAQPVTPSLPTAVVAAQPSCATPTATIVVSAPTGAGMTYSIDGATYSNTSGLFTGVAIGTYSVTARTAAGCISPSTSLTVNPQPSMPATPTATVTQQPTCAIATGTITITAPMATGMTYSVDGSDYSNTTGVFTSLTDNTYSVTARNSSGCTSSAVNLTINPQPDVPTVTSAVATSPTMATCPLGNDGTITINATGISLEYSIDSGVIWQASNVFNGLTARSYKGLIRSTASNCAVQSIPAIIVVAPYNCKPLPVDDYFTLQRNTFLNAPVLLNDTDDHGLNPASLTIFKNGSKGTATPLVSGQINYVPQFDKFGFDTITYRICDYGLPILCDTAHLYIDIVNNGINNPPVLVRDSIAIPQDTTAVTVRILDNDYDTDGGLVNSSLTVTTNPLHGTFTVNTGTGVVVYTPTAGFHGLDSFRYRVCDNFSPPTCAQQWAIINVLPVNSPPIAVKDTFRIAEDTPLTGTVTTNDSDTDTPAQTLSYLKLDNTTVQGSAWAMTPTGTFQYTPPLNFVGKDSMQYKVCDNGAPVLCSNAWIVITVTPVNDTPSVILPSAIVPEDSVVTVCSTVTDVDATDSHTVTFCAQPAHGTATKTFNNATKAVCITYKPTTNYNGKDTMCVIVCDNGTPSLCDTVKMPIKVLARPDTPMTVIPPITTLIDTFARVCSKIVDADSTHIFSATICTAPAHGTAIPTVIGDSLCIEFTPEAGFPGIDEVCIEICDETDLCRQIKVPIVVTDCPVVVDSVQVADATCPSKRDGQIKIFASGTNSPMEFTVWKGQEWQGSNTFTRLKPGFYFVQARKANGCVYDYGAVEITAPATCIEICNDGIDNDDDGLIDIEDELDCKPKAIIILRGKN